VETRAWLVVAVLCLYEVIHHQTLDSLCAVRLPASPACRRCRKILGNDFHGTRFSVRPRYDSSYELPTSPGANAN
jgi:hypothetical protein